MKCYDCEHGVEAEAVAVCRHCGKGLCRAHAHERRIHAYREEASGMGVVRRACVHDRPEILCEECLRTETCCDGR